MGVGNKGSLPVARHVLGAGGRSGRVRGACPGAWRGGAQPRGVAVGVAPPLPLSPRPPPPPPPASRRRRPRPAAARRGTAWRGCATRSRAATAGRPRP